MLISLMPHLPETPADGEQIMDKKSQDIVKAIVGGHSCEQVLAGDSTLTHHDVFRAISEAPTGFWEKASAASGDSRLPGDTISVQRSPTQRRD